MPRASEYVIQRTFQRQTSKGLFYSGVFVNQVIELAKFPIAKIFIVGAKINSFTRPQLYFRIGTEFVLHCYVGLICQNRVKVDQKVKSRVQIEKLCSISIKEKVIISPYMYTEP